MHKISSNIILIAVGFIIIYSGINAAREYLPNNISNFIVLIEATITTVLVMTLVTAYQRGRDLDKMSDKIADTVTGRVKPEIDEVIESLVPGT